MTRRLKILSLAAATCIGLGLIGAIWVAGLLSAPAPRPAPSPPEYLEVEDVYIPSESGSRLSAWYSTPDNPSAAIVLLHCVRCSRIDMLSRAELLWRSGFAVLLPDLQAHGESPGEAITFGYLESRDAAASIKYLRSRHPSLPIGALGVSLGGASLTLGATSAPMDAVVLEAVYPTIEEAVTNRIAIRLGPLAKVLTPLLLVQLEPRLGFSPRDLHPIDHIQDLTCPILIAAGTRDQHTTRAETRRLFDAASPPKKLWFVEGAAHEDLLRFDPESYQEMVVGFLREALIGKSGPPDSAQGTASSEKNPTARAWSEL